MICFKCLKEIVIKPPAIVGRGEDCPHCGTSAHVCKNCEFYDPKAYNECRESSAERVVEKEKPNFCDQFSPNHVGPKDKMNAQNDVLKKAQSLFKK